LDDALLAWNNRKFPGSGRELRLIEVPAQASQESQSAPLVQSPGFSTPSDGSALRPATSLVSADPIGETVSAAAVQRSVLSAEIHRQRLRLRPAPTNTSLLWQREDRASRLDDTDWFTHHRLSVVQEEDPAARKL
jgi:hypothetical protein